MTAVAVGATAALSEAVRDLMTRLATVVQQRLRRNRSDQDALDAARAPHDDTTVHRLAEVVEQHICDPAFADQPAGS